RDRIASFIGSPGKGTAAPPCDGTAASLERVMGIEPTLAAWEAAVLPLNYTRAAPDLSGTPARSEAPPDGHEHAGVVGVLLGEGRGRADVGLQAHQLGPRADQQGAELAVEVDAGHRVRQRLRDRLRDREGLLRLV